MDFVSFSSYQEAVDKLGAAGFKADFPKSIPVKDVVNANPPPGYPQWIGPRVLGHRIRAVLYISKARHFHLCLKTRKR